MPVADFLKRLEEDFGVKPETEKVEDPLKDAIERLELPPRSEWKYKKPVGVGEKLATTKYEEKLPFIGSIVAAGRSGSLNDAINRLKEEQERIKETGYGTHNPWLESQLKKDRKTVEDFVAAGEYLKARGGETYGAKVAGGVTDLVSYASEFLFTLGPALKVGTKAATGLGKVVGKDVLARSGGEAITKGLTTAATQAALSPGRVAERQQEIMRPEVMFDKKGNLLIGESPDAVSSFFKSYGDLVIESLSERMGGLFGKAGLGIKKAIPKKIVDEFGGMFKKAVKKTGLNPGHLSKILEKSGYNGMLSEMGEERMGDIMRYMVGLQGFKDIIPTLDELLVEAGIFAVPGALNVVGGVVARTTEEQKAYILSDKNVADFKQNKPDVAAELEKLVSPTRKQFEKAGIKEKLNVQERKEFVEKLKATAYTPEIIEAPAEKPTEPVLKPPEPSPVPEVEKPAEVVPVAPEPTTIGKEMKPEGVPKEYDINALRAKREDILASREVVGKDDPEYLSDELADTEAKIGMLEQMFEEGIPKTAEDINRLQMLNNLEKQEKRAKTTPLPIKKFPRKTIVRAFPGQSVAETETGYKVTLARGQEINIDFVPEIPFSKADVEKQLGKPISNKEFEKMAAAGSHSITFDDKTSMPVSSLIKINTQLATDATLRHESIHFAHKAGMFKKKEWDALVRKYSDPSKPEAVQEEDIAKAAPAWEKKKVGLTDKILAFINKLLSKLGLAEVSAEQAELLTRQPGFWERPAQAKKAEGEKAFEIVKKDMGEIIGSPAHFHKFITEQPEVEGYLYHGSPQGYIGELDPYTHTRTWREGIGIYATDSRSKALRYKKGKKSGRLNYIKNEAKNIFDLDAPINKEFWKKAAEYLETTEPEDAKTNMEAMWEIRSNLSDDFDATEAPYRIEDWFRTQNIDATVHTEGKKSGNPHKVYIFKGDIYTLGGQAFNTVKAKNIPMEEVYKDYVKQKQPNISEQQFEIINRPELANPALTPEARGLVDIVDIARKQEGIPEVRADIEVDQEADRRLAADYEGEKKKLLQSAKRVHNLDADANIAGKIITREGTEAIKSKDKSKLEDAIALTVAYRNSGTEVGRALRQRYDRLLSPAQRAAKAITLAILTPDKKRFKKINKALAQGDTATAEKLQNQWADQIEVLAQDLLDMGVDLTNIQDHMRDPVVAVKALAKIKAAKADWSDKLYEYWRNSILWHPKTHIVNFLSNTAHVGWRYTVQKFVEALVNTVVRDPKSTQWSDFKHILRGFLPGIARGYRNFFLAWDSEAPVLERQLGSEEGTYRIEDTNIALRGKFGRFIRAPQRFLLASDEMTKSVIAEVEAGLAASRIAKREGLEGDAFADRVSELTMDISSEAWRDVMEPAREATFQSEMGKISKLALKARREIPGLRYILPFITTPVNIFKTGLRMTPLEFFVLPNKIIDAVATGDWRKANPAIARNLIAWGIFIVILCTNDPDDPWITGASGETNRGKREFARRTYPTNSFHFGDYSISFSRMPEPFSTAMSWLADMSIAIKTGGPIEGFKEGFANVANQMKDKTFMQTVGDTMQALESDSPDKISRMASSFATSWMPNLVRGTGREFQDVYPERGVWGEGAERYERIAKRTVQRLELGIYEDLPAVDIWGRLSPKSSDPVFGSDLFYRLISPMEAKKRDVFKGDMLLRNWNLQNPGKEIYPVTPQKSYKSTDGETKYMTDEQYNKYAQLAGETARRLVEMEITDPHNPAEQDVEKLTAAIRDARSMVKEALVKEWEGGPPASVDTGEIANKLYLKDIKSQIEKLARPVPLKKTKEKSIAELRAEREEMIQEARQWLKKSGITEEELKKHYREIYKSPKDANVYAYRLGRAMKQFRQ